MESAIFLVDNAKVMPKGQITLPKDIRKALGLGSGDRVTLVYDGEKVTMMNSAVYAMRVLQKEMSGEAEKAGFATEEDVMEYVTQFRREEDCRK